MEETKLPKSFVWWVNNDPVNNLKLHMWGAVVFCVFVEHMMYIHTHTSMLHCDTYSYQTSCCSHVLLCLSGGGGGAVAGMREFELWISRGRTGGQRRSVSHWQSLVCVITAPPLVQVLFLRRGQREINELKGNISAALRFRASTSRPPPAWTCRPHPVLPSLTPNPACTCLQVWRRSSRGPWSKRG